MKKYPVIYKLNSNGSINQWQIITDGDSYYSIEGLVDGKLTTSKPSKCEAMNIGRANETTVEEQAEKEALAKWKKQIEKGYKEDIKDVAEGAAYFKAMLAHTLIDYKDKLKYPLLVSRKIDGLRMICTKSGLTTRNGKPFNSCPHISEILKPVFDKHPNWVIDGEIYSDLVPFEKIVSLTRQKNPNANDIAESKKYCQLWIFDGVIDNKNEGFTSRFDIITKEINNLIGDSKSLKFVENIAITKFEEIEIYHNKFVAEGLEGLMARIPDSIYENKRSKNLLKYKHFFDEEYIIVDIVEGSGNRAGMAGNIVIKLKDGRQCSSGIKGGEEFYTELFKNKASYIGKKVTVRYQEMTNDNFPRFPVAVAFDPIDR